MTKKKAAQALQRLSHFKPGLRPNLLHVREIKENKSQKVYNRMSFTLSEFLGLCELGPGGKSPLERTKLIS